MNFYTTLYYFMRIVNALHVYVVLFLWGDFVKPLKVKVSITLDVDVVSKIKELSERDGRSLSQYINLVLRKHIEDVDEQA